VVGDGKGIPLGISLSSASPAELATLLQSEMTKWGSIVKASGAKAD